MNIVVWKFIQFQLNFDDALLLQYDFIATATDRYFMYLSITIISRIH